MNKSKEYESRLVEKFVNEISKMNEAQKAYVFKQMLDNKKTDPKILKSLGRS